MFASYSENNVTASSGSSVLKMVAMGPQKHWLISIRLHRTTFLNVVVFMLLFLVSESISRGNCLYKGDSGVK